MSDTPLHFDTLKVRAGYDSSQHNYSVQVPIYQTASYDLGSVERADRLLEFQEYGYLYSRVGNPTVAALEARLTALDGGHAAIAFASGMAAISATLLNLTEGKGSILTTPKLYGGTFDAFAKLLPRLGTRVDFAEKPEDPESFRKALKADTKAIFIETISNPNATLLDIEAIAKVAHDHGIPLVIDNTFATPYLFRPFEHGADIVIYSATKALTGHGSTIAGVVIESGKFDYGNGKFPQFEEPIHLLRDRKTGRKRSFLEVFPKEPITLRLRFTYLAYLGAALGPFDAYQVIIGLETLSERVAKQVASAKRIVEYLENHPQVAWVSHPAAKTFTQKELAARYFPKGAGSIFAFGYKGSEAERTAFINALTVFSYHANVGDARSLVINSPKTTHGELDEAEQAAAGIPPETVRLSIGLEDPEDLIADLGAAFAKAGAK
jgi:O-acetylhomoserine (thiol)-lyase